MRATQPDIPTTAEQVLESVGYYKTKSINNFTQFESASKIGPEQFALFNINYPDPLDRYSFPDAMEKLAKYWPWDEAERLVKRSTSLQDMLGALETNTKVKDIAKGSKHWPAEFVPILRLLEDIRQPRSKTTGQPGTEEEEEKKKKKKKEEEEARATRPLSSTKERVWEEAQA